MTIAMLALLTTYPALEWLTQAPSFERMTLVLLLWLSFFFGMYNGAMAWPLLFIRQVVR